MSAKTAIAGLAVLLGTTLPLTCAASAPEPAATVFSLDQCADQFVLALAPRAAIVGLSPRARNPDSYLAPQAKGLPVRRADAESLLTTHPTIVVRAWGGEGALLRLLDRRGVRVVRIEDAIDFSGVRRNVRTVALALGNVQGGEALIGRLDANLAAARGAWHGRGALYLTSGGATAGSGTLIDAILAAAGLRNLAGGAGYRSVSLEKLELDPPDAVVLGFFDPASQAQVHWGPGSHGALRRLVSRRTMVSLPGALLGCPAWFSGEAVAQLAAAAPSRASARCGNSSTASGPPCA